MQRNSYKDPEDLLTIAKKQGEYPDITRYPVGLILGPYVKFS